MAKSDEDGTAAKEGEPGSAAARSAERGLDWFNLFVANIQTGFGPFISIYLTTEGWTQTAIGVALSLSTITAMASQLPAGALVDAVRRKSRVAAFSVACFTASAMIFALVPVPLFIYLAEVLHGFSSSTLGPAVVAMSRAVVGKAALGLRLGRNARYASIGNGIGAALMGAVGYYLAPKAVFFLTAALTLPALAALIPLSGPGDRVPQAWRSPGPSGDWAQIRHLLADRRLLIFAACAMLFTLADSAMLPLAGAALTTRAGSKSSLLIAACIVLPQVIVALLSPAVGRYAEARGRRALLLLGFATLPLRGLLFAVVGDPALVVLVQALDGVAAASFGVLMPLVTSDIAGGTRHFNLALGFVGFAIGIGGTFSTTMAGWIGDRYGDPAAFASLALVGLVATLLVWLAMPETRPAPEEP